MKATITHSPCINTRASNGGFSPFVTSDPVILYTLKMVAINALGVLDLEHGDSADAHSISTSQLRDALSSAFLCGVNHATALGMAKTPPKEISEAPAPAPRFELPMPSALDASFRADRRVSLQGHAS